ncbi:MAG: hypothetical protein IT349_16615 [Candidatus Eisenbacteria bacterium]|nr:hypothetical protein [Candidatus Eisenbacteria bacterium]MCC7143724.1 hypothetical protein [Candidatus Eisenbacteria bacterium]
MSQTNRQMREVEQTGSLAERSGALKTAAGDWANGLKDVAKQRVVVAGQNTEQYVKSHPGRFILGACCVGLAAGWLLGRGRRS